MPGATTKVTFKVEYSQLSPGERLGLIIWGEFGRLQEIVLSTAGRMHFTHPVPLASLDRVEYSYVLLSDSRSPVSSARTRAQHPLPGSETLPSALSRPSVHSTPDLTPSLARLATVQWSPRAWRCWCRTL
jgi:hypothetical protein